MPFRQVLPKERVPRDDLSKKRELLPAELNRWCAHWNKFHWTWFGQHPPGVTVQFPVNAPFPFPESTIEVPNFPSNIPWRSIEGWILGIQWFIPARLSQKVRKLVTRVVLVTWYPPERDRVALLLQALNDIVRL